MQVLQKTAHPEGFVHERHTRRPAHSYYDDAMARKWAGQINKYCILPGSTKQRNKYGDRNMSRRKEP